MGTPNKRHRFFAKEYVVDSNATQAAIRAGYSARTAKQQGSRLLTYVDVQSEVARLEREQRQAEKVDREYVIAGLRELAENAESEAARVRALELLGKTMRMFVEVTEATTVHDVSALKQYSLAELVAMRNSVRPAIEAEARVVDG